MKMKREKTSTLTANREIVLMVLWGPLADWLHFNIHCTTCCTHNRFEKTILIYWWLIFYSRNSTRTRTNSFSVYFLWDRHQLLMKIGWVSVSNEHSHWLFINIRFNSFDFFFCTDNFCFSSYFDMNERYIYPYFFRLFYFNEKTHSQWRLARSSKKKKQNTYSSLLLNWIQCTV